MTGNDGKEFTAYIIQCTGVAGVSWETAKRFTDFSNLRAALIEAACDDVEAYEFPGKMSGMWKSKEAVEEERVAGFSGWLQKVLGGSPPSRPCLYQVLIRVWSAP